MNRTFHVKITAGACLLVGLLAVLMGWAFWTLQPLVGMGMAMALIVVIEHIIHSSYTLTSDGQLILYRGRFRRRQVVRLTDIAEVELKSAPLLGNLLASCYVLVRLASGAYLSLQPVRPEELMQVLVRRLEHREEDDEEEDMEA